MKRLIALFFSFLLCLMPVIGVSASEISETDISVAYISDELDIFSSEGEVSLTDMVLDIKDSYGCDVGIYTVDVSDVSFSDMQAFGYADNHYETTGFSNDGILLMIYSNGDELGSYIKTSGKGASVVSDLDLNVIYNNFEKYLFDGYYFEAARSYINDCTREFQRHNTDFSMSEPIYIKDDANILTNSEEKTLKEKILAIREEYQCDVAFYSVDFGSASISDYEAQCHAEEHYTLSGLSSDGILLMIFFAGNGNGTHMTTSGECIKMFTEDDFLNIEDNFYNHLVDRNYYRAVESFVSDSKDDIHDYKNFDGIWYFIAPAIGAITSFFSVGKMKGDLKSVRSKPNASDYTKSGSVNITRSNDVFMYRRVTRTAKPKDTSSSSGRSGGGGSFGGHSGRRF